MQPPLRSTTVMTRLLPKRRLSLVQNPLRLLDFRLRPNSGDQEVCSTCRRHCPSHHLRRLYLRKPRCCQYSPLRRLSRLLCCHTVPSLLLLPQCLYRESLLPSAAVRVAARTRQPLQTNWTHTRITYPGKTCSFQDGISSTLPAAGTRANTSSS